MNEYSRTAEKKRIPGRGAFVILTVEKRPGIEGDVDRKSFQKKAATAKYHKTAG